MNTMNNKIISRFYVITLNQKPVYVGYTNRPIEQRFNEHKRDKDFGKIQPEIKQIAQLEYEFTWDTNKIDQYANEVNDKECELIKQFKTQNSKYQKADGGGQNWNDIKYFVNTNNNNPKFLNMPEADVLKRIENEHAINKYMQHFTTNMHNQATQYIQSFIKTMNNPATCYINNCVNSMNNPLTQYMKSFIINMNNPATRYINDCINSIKNPPTQYMKNFINHMNNPATRYVYDCINDMKEPKMQYMKNFIGNMNNPPTQYMKDFINHMNNPATRYINNFIGNMH